MEIFNISSIINVISADFRTLWKILFHHQIQPVVMCPVCTQLCTRIESLLSQQSSPVPGHAVCQISSLHTSGWQEYVQLWWMLSAMNVWSLLIFHLPPDTRPLHLYKVFWGVLELPKSQPHSQAVAPDKTCNEVAESCGKGSQVLKTSRVHLSLVCPPMLSIKMSTAKCNDPRVLQVVSSSKSLDIIKCQLVCEPSLFVPLGNVVECQR